MADIPWPPSQSNSGIALYPMIRSLIKGDITLGNFFCEGFLKIQFVVEQVVKKKQL